MPLPIGPAIRILSKIPWKEVLKYGPEIMNAASKLRKNNQSNDHTKPQSAETKTDPLLELASRIEMNEHRISVLELNEKEQSRLINDMAERQELLLGIVRVLDMRIKILFGTSIVMASALVFTVIRHLYS